MYADDANILWEIPSQSDAEAVQSDIQKLEKWTEKWLLRFHLDKCHVLSLGKIESTMCTHRYRICKQEMEQVFEKCYF